MVFEDIFTLEFPINKFFIAACLLIAGLIIGYLWKVIIAKISKNTFYPWIRKNSPGSYKKTYSIVTAVTLIVYWMIILLFLIEALATFDLNVINPIINAILDFSPKVSLAFIILIAGLIIANVFSNRMERKKFPYSSVFASLSEILIIIATILASLETLGIKVTAFNYLFIGIVISIALAFAIAFGIAFGLALKPEVTKLFSELRNKK